MIIKTIDSYIINRRRKNSTRILYVLQTSIPSLCIYHTFSDIGTGTLATNVYNIQLGGWIKCMWNGRCRYYIGIARKRRTDYLSWALVLILFASLAECWTIWLRFNDFCQWERKNWNGLFFYYCCCCGKTGSKSRILPNMRIIFGRHCRQLCETWYLVLERCVQRYKIICWEFGCAISREKSKNLAWTKGKHAFIVVYNTFTQYFHSHLERFECITLTWVNCNRSTTPIAVPNTK